MMGSAGPLADSIVYCGNDRILKLPHMPRVPKDLTPTATNENPTSNDPNAQTNAELAKQAVDNAITWSRENGIPTPWQDCVEPLID
jgi:hypothetical protein